MCPRLASFLYVLEGGLWLLSILPPPTEYWDGSHVTPLRSQALCQSGKGSTSRATSSAFSFLYVHIFTLYVCRVRRAPIQRQRTTRGHAFPFHHVSPVDGTQLARLGSRHLYPLSHLTVHPTSQPFSLGSFSSQWEACCHFSSFGSSGERWASDWSPTLPF